MIRKNLLQGQRRRFHTPLHDQILAKRQTVQVKLALPSGQVTAVKIRLGHDYNPLISLQQEDLNPLSQRMKRTYINIHYDLLSNTTNHHVV